MFGGRSRNFCNSDISGFFIDLVIVNFSGFILRSVSLRISFKFLSSSAAAKINVITGRKNY